jgi:hypothetical protein
VRPEGVGIARRLAGSRADIRQGRTLRGVVFTHGRGPNDSRFSPPAGHPRPTTPKGVGMLAGPTLAGDISPLQEVTRAAADAFDADIDSKMPLRSRRPDAMHESC